MYRYTMRELVRSPTAVDPSWAQGRTRAAPLNLSLFDMWSGITSVASGAERLMLS